MDAAATACTVDGNAIAGMLSDLFGGDVTAMIGTCGCCGSESVLAQAVVELDPAAAIVRCRTCTRTLFTVLHGRAGTPLIIGGLHGLRADVGTPA